MANSNYKVVFSDGFHKKLRKLSDTHRKALMKKLLFLQENPFYPSLRTQKLEGDSELYESSVNMDIRFLWAFRENRVIALADIGHHDVLKKY